MYQIFHAWRFFSQTAANTDAISFIKPNQQPSASESDCNLITAPTNLKPMLVTLARLEVFEEVPIAYEFSISEAQIKNPTKLPHKYNIRDLRHAKFFGYSIADDFLKIWDKI